MSFLSDIAGTVFGYRGIKKANERLAATQEQNLELQRLDREDQLAHQSQLEYEAAPFKQLERFRAGMPLPEEQEAYRAWLYRNMVSPISVAGILAGLAEQGFVDEDNASGPQRLQGHRPHNKMSSLMSLVSQNLPVGGQQYNPNAAMGFLNHSLYNQIGPRPMRQFSAYDAGNPVAMQLLLGGLGRGMDSGLGGLGGWGGLGGLGGLDRLGGFNSYY